MDSLTELFCLREDCCRRFEPAWPRHELTSGARKRRRSNVLSLSEVMTLMVLFHQLRFRQFKRFYLDYGCRYRRPAFPTLPSYPRCVALLPRGARPLAAVCEALKGSCDGISIVDATPLAVCDHRRITRHRVFRNIAARGQTSMGWFDGFKLHTLINSRGELLRLKLTAGNVDDRKLLPHRCRGLFGYLLADKGYLAQRLTQALAERNSHLITTRRKNMKPAPRTAFEKARRRRRCLLETVCAELKHLCQIEPTRHRSVGNFRVNLMAGLVAYCWADNKPTLQLMRVNVLAAP